MKVFIPAAGKGTRLGAFTENMPKALVDVAGKPMLYHLVKRLKEYGFNEFVINVHHFADIVEEYLRKHDNFNVNVTIADERDQLLNTGGGLVNAAKYFHGEEPFLVHNVDVLTNLDLKSFYDSHIKDNNDISLIVMHRKTSRYLLFNDEMLLRGWENRTTGEQILFDKTGELSPLAFGGIHIVNPAAVDLLHPDTEIAAFPIIPEYIRTCGKQKIRGVHEQEIFWLDMGKPEHLKTAESYLLNPDN